MALKKVNKVALKDAVNTQLEKVTQEHEVVITGARVIKDGRLELEFAQSRKLRQSKSSVLALLNKVDELFNTNTRQVVRIWHRITLDGAREAFNIDFQPIHDAAQGMSDDERVMVMWKIEKFFAEGEEFQLNIKVHETTDIERLLESMSEDIKSINQYAESHKLQSPTGPNGELEPIVDAEGNFVYRWHELDYILPDTDISDELISEKISLSDYKQKFLKENSEKVYITRSNLERITRKTKTDIVLEGKIHDRPIYFFSEFEIKNLLSLKIFIKSL